jgi:hypothetical protein
MMLTSIVTYAAATILLAAAIRPDSSVDLDSEPHKDSWWKAIHALKHNKVQLHASFRAVEVLEDCRGKLRSTMKLTAGMDLSQILIYKESNSTYIVKQIY